MVTKNFFYFVEKGKFCIGDIGYITESDKTIEIPLFDIANNEKLLYSLKLVYIRGNNYTYESRAEWFCSYLSQFNNRNAELQFKKSMENPTVRILFEESELMEVVQKCL